MRIRRPLTQRLQTRRNAHECHQMKPIAILSVTLTLLLAAHAATRSATTPHRPSRSCTTAHALSRFSGPELGELRRLEQQERAQEPAEVTIGNDRHGSKAVVIASLELVWPGLEGQAAEHKAS